MEESLQIFSGFFSVLTRKATDYGVKDSWACPKSILGLKDIQIEYLYFLWKSGAQISACGPSLCYHDQTMSYARLGLALLMIKNHDNQLVIPLKSSTPRQQLFSTHQVREILP